MSDFTNSEKARKTELFDFLVVALPAEGSVSDDVAELPEGVDHWRRTARAVGRQLSRPIRTLVFDGRVHAVLDDWPASPEETERSREKLRQASAAASLSDRIDPAGWTSDQDPRNRQTIAAVPHAQRPVQIAGIEVVSLEQNVVTEFESTPVVGTVVARRSEASLVDDYAAHLRALGHTLGRHRIRIADGGSQLATDLLDETDGILYEAKSSADRSTIRLGLGQILDYRRLLDSEELGYRLLLPMRPLGELVDLLAYYEIGVTWRDRDEWCDEPPPSYLP